MSIEDATKNMKSGRAKKEGSNVNNKKKRKDSVFKSLNQKKSPA